MGVLSDIRGVIRGALSNPKEQVSADASEGAYWCHDCNERVLDLDVVGEGPPTCPRCGDGMTFERAIGSAACAC